MTKVKLLLAILFVSFSSAGYTGDNNLYFEGGMESLLALKKDFFIGYEDQVSDGCLPQPYRLKDAIEISLRKNGFNILEKEKILSDQIRIVALGFSISNTDVCAVNISAKLVMYSPVLVPYAIEVSSGNKTFVPIVYEFGNVILTGRKNTMQSRIEKAVKGFGDDLYLKISRSKDMVSNKFPEIIEYYKKMQNKKN